MNTGPTYNDFSWNLAAQYLQKTTSNACISPPGVFLLLSAIAAASAGLTKEELDQVLGGTALQAVSDEDYFSNIRWLNDLMAQCPVLRNNTSIQIPAMYHLQQEYRSKLKDAFGDKLNIQTARDKAVTLQNLIVFHDKWETKFKETTEIFYENPYVPTGYTFRSFEDMDPMEPISNQLATQTTTQITGQCIPYIHQDEAPGSRVQENEKFISVAVPFSTDCHMVLSMPKNRPLDECLGDVDFLRSALDVSGGRPARMNLYLPSFKLKNSLDLIPILTAMGANEVFDKYEGQITKMVNDRLYIESGRQETEVKVTAEGAYAKALTTFSVKATASCSFSSLTRTVTFNHPFLFAIWQTKPTPIPLFIGTFQKPE